MYVQPFLGVLGVDIYHPVIASETPVRVPFKDTVGGCRDGEVSSKIPSQNKTLPERNNESDLMSPH